MPRSPSMISTTTYRGESACAFRNGTRLSLQFISHRAVQLDEPFDLVLTNVHFDFCHRYGTVLAAMETPTTWE